MRPSTYSNTYSAKNNLIYDDAFGIYVKKLRDCSDISTVKKYPDRVWYHLETSKGCEQKLADMLSKKAIPIYFPRFQYISVFGQKDQFFGKLLFPGNVFAALNQSEIIDIENVFLVKKISDAKTEEAEKSIFSDISFMNLAERINRNFELHFAETMFVSDGKWKETPMTIEGSGNASLFSKDEDMLFYFQFAHPKQIIYFELSLYQFRSLLKSQMF